MISIHITTTLQQEFRYVCAVLFEEFLGLDHAIYFVDDLESIELSFEAKRICFQADFWKNDSYKAELIPQAVTLAQHAFFPEENIPVLFGSGEIQTSETEIRCAFDLFATCFFMLSRWEELVKPQKDADQRFPGKESVAHRFGFLERPVVDEYCETIWNMLQFLNISLKRKTPTREIKVTCDVDHPFDPSVRNMKTYLKTAVADVIKRKSIATAFKRTRLFVSNRLKNYRHDSHYTFGKYMDLCEKHNLKATFFFISDSSETKNGSYRLSDPRVLALLQEINDRGHEIALHGSYQSYLNPDKLIREKHMLQTTLDKLGIDREIKGNRQHYLRWDSTQTPSFLDQAGFEYDSTGGYADLPGFRYGTAREFSLWDLKSREKLRLKERPLIVMECTYFDEEFLNLPVSDEVKMNMNQLKNTALKYGDFCFLWHNNRFSTGKEFELFEFLLKPTVNLI